MKIAMLKSFALAAALVCGVSATQAASVAAAKRPAAVPPGYVITPFGYFHSSCVVHLGKGDELRQNEHVVRHADGSAEAMHVCSYSHYTADGEEVGASQPIARTPDISHAWVEYASTTTSKAYGYLYGEWTVPPGPSTNDGQTLFFFPGMEDIDDVVTIIQPVLGWNSDYGSAWGIASWNCCENGTTYEAAPQPVSSGDTILGYMFDTCSAGTKTCGSWDIVTEDLQSGNYSELLDTSSFGQTFNWAFGGVMEVYNIAQCGDYPSNGTISFNELGLFNDSFDQIPKPKWSVSNISGGLSPQCGYGGSLPTQVLLNY